MSAQSAAIAPACPSAMSEVVRLSAENAGLKSEIEVLREQLDDVSEQLDDALQELALRPV